MSQPKTENDRFLSVFIVTCIVLILICAVVIACFLIHDHMLAVQEQEASIRAHEAEHNQTVRSFPHKMTISGKTANITRVDLFEVYSNHGYTGFVIVTIDRRNLSDDDMYWLLKLDGLSRELDADAHYWPDGTDGDIASLHYLGCRYTESNIYFMFYTKHQRYSLNGVKFSISVTYRPDGSSITDGYRYSYRVDFTGTQYHDGIVHLPEEMQRIFTNALDDAAS